MSIDSHPERVPNLREFADNYDLSGLELPVSLKQIEAKNNISLNVLGLEGKDIYILRNSNRTIIGTRKGPRVAPIEKLIC